MAEQVVKQYVECGVQTDDLKPHASPTSPVARIPLLDSPHIRKSSVSESTLPASSHSSHSRSSTQFDSAFSYASEPTDREGSVSPVQSLSTNVRGLKRQQLPFNRPTRVSSHKAVTSRVVSLPEVASTSPTNAVLEQTARVVSMPVPNTIGDSSLLLDGLDISGGSGDAFLSEGEERSRVRVGRRGVDILRTPSPPSSPESVLIIANNNQLSIDFLRNNAHIEDHPETHPDDEGWISWAKSPPRPIPALHGPLSLPYARCPSGAEGTIIEEQDSLSRMIWGLEGEELPTTRQRPDAPTQTSYHAPSHRGASHPNHNNIPPRFQKPKITTEFIPSFERLSIQDFSRSRAPAPTLDREGPLTMSQQQHDISGYPIRGQEPIDLSEIVRQRREDLMNGQYDQGFSNNRAYSRDIRSYDYNDVGLDWHSALAAQEKLIHAGLLLPSPPVRGNELNDHLSPAFSSSSRSSVPYLGSTRSPIILEPQQPSHGAGQPRRMSALEIAQKYRQQQMQQQQSLLPTPPNSTSPIWSSNFSPYKDSLISPELLSVSRLPQLLPSGWHQSTLLRADDSHSQQPRRSTQEQLNSTVLGLRDIDGPSLAPAVQIDNLLLQKAQARSLASYLSDLSAVSPFAQFMQAQKRSAPAVPSHVTHVDRSPSMPRPPPNTPLSSLTSSKTNMGGRGHAQATVLETPPSPTSPKERLRSFSHQQTRSIPLARLIQRRLSSVPEEEASELPPAHSSAQRMRSFTLGSHANPSPRKDVELPPSPPSPLVWPLRTQSPAHGMLVPQSKRGVGPPEGVRPAQATVRLPGRAQEQGSGAHGRDNSGRRREGASNMRFDDTRGKGQRRGRGKRGRGASASGGSYSHNRPERVDGGMMVKS